MRRWLPLGLALVAIVLPARAGGHAGHDGHGSPQPVGGAAVVTVDNYRIELQAEPAPLTAGRASRLVARVLTVSPPAPVSGGHVEIGMTRDTVPDTFAVAREVTWAGSYAAPVNPARPGAHAVQIRVHELPGRSFIPPLVLDFKVDVSQAAGLGAVGWLALAVTGGIAVVGLYAVALSTRKGAPAGDRLDLLELRWLRGLLTSSVVQQGLQVVAVALTAGVVLLGFADVQDGARNVATKFTWTVWWAGVIFTFVLAGRVWCVACPFGALNEWTARATGARRRLPAIFRNLWWATGAFVLLTWADELLGVVRFPVVTAWLVVGFAATAVAVGLAFERRSFCRYLCPIGGLIGLYSMTAPLELRAREGSVCRGHRDKECYRGSPASRGCPMFEFPQAMDRNNNCILCAECVKGCSRGNVVLRFRAFGRDLWASAHRFLDEAYLAVALVGLTLVVTAQMLEAWAGWVSGLARWLPTAVRASMKPVVYLSAVETVLLLGGTLVAAPLVVLAGAAVADRLAGPARIGRRRTFVTFAYMFVPVGLAMHLAHNLEHLLVEGGGIVPAVQRAVALWTPWSLGQPDWEGAALASTPVVGLLQMAVVVGFFALSLVAGHRLALRAYPDRATGGRALMPFAILSFLFTVAGIVVLNQPMGMRHGM